MSLDLKALRELHAKTTPGEWVRNDGRIEAVTDDELSPVLAVVRHASDAAFIVAAKAADAKQVAMTAQADALAYRLRCEQLEKRLEERTAAIKRIMAETVSVKAYGVADKGLRPTREDESARTLEWHDLRRGRSR